MAVMDQDNFSNISWHSEQNPDLAGPSTSASTARDPASNNGADHSKNRSDGHRTADHGGHLEGGHLAGEVLECVVSEPHKENDGTKDAYVSYLITTHVGHHTRPRLTC